MSLISLVMMGSGFGLVVASSAVGEKIDRGSPLLRPMNPLGMNAASGIAGITALIAAVGGFFLYGWVWAAVMWAGIIGTGLVFISFPSAPVLTIVAGLLGTVLIIIGWTAF